MFGLSKKYWIAVICKLCYVFTSFLVTIFINRGLGVTSKGEYSYIINLVEMLYVILSLGIGQSYSTFRRNSGEKTRGIFIALGWNYTHCIWMADCHFNRISCYKDYYFNDSCN